MKQRGFIVLAILALLSLWAWADINKLNGTAVTADSTIMGVTGLTAVNGLTLTGGGGGGFTYYSAIFDGTNDWLSRGANVTGMANGKTGLLSFWIKLGSGTDDTNQYVMTNTFGAFGFMVLRRAFDNSIRIIGCNSGFTEIITLTSNAESVNESSGWVHVLASWDLGTAGRRHLYINGSAQTNVGAFTDDTIVYVVGNNFYVGSNESQSSKLNGILSEVYFTTEWLDITDSANRLKFRTAGGLPENLGADGSTPTGTAPLLYFHDEVTGWEVNKGSGGGFTENGTLGDGGADKP